MPGTLLRTEVEGSGKLRIARKGNKKMIRSAILIAMLMAVLLVAACGGSGAQQSNAPTPGGDGTEESGSNGEEAPVFGLTTLEGDEFDLAEKRGEVVALFFTAGWCDSCIPEAQAWSGLYPAYEDRGLDLLMVSIDPSDTPQAIEGFQRKSGIRPLSWAIDETGEVSRSLNVGALGSTVIVDREGRIAYRDASETDAETLQRELEEVL